MTVVSWLGGASFSWAQANYTSGFMNSPQTAEPGTLLSHPDTNDSANIGRTTTVNYLRGWVIVGGEAPGSRSGSDLRMRVYDISNPANPQRKLPSDFGLTYANDLWYSGNFGFGAHGTTQAGNYIYAPQVRVETFGGVVDKGGSFSTLYPTLSSARGSMAGSWGASFPWYGTTDQNFTIRKRFRTGSTQITRTLAEFDHVGPYGGGDWHPLFFGDLLIYARSGSAGNDGVVVYRLQYNDFDTPASATVTPQLVGTLQGGFRAYWPVLFSDGSGLYVVGSETNILMAADISQAADPAGDGSVTMARSMTVSGFTNASYPVFQDQNAFIHNRRINMAQFLAGNPNPITLTLNETAVGVDTTQMSLPLGNLWLTGGYQRSGKSQGMAVWVQQKAPDTKKPEISYHIPQSGRANYPRHAPLSFLLHEVPRNGGLRNGIDFTVRPVLENETLGTPVAGYLIHDMSGVLTFNQDAGLEADRTYQVDFLSNPANGVGFQDASGNWLNAYSFRFSTGGGVNASQPPVVTAGADTYHPAPGGNFVMTATANGNGPFEYRFNFDGAWTEWGSSASASYSYAEAGRYRAFVQVRDANGNLVTESVRILVTPPLSAVSPTRSGPLEMDDDGRLWVVNPDSDTVSVVRASDGTKLGEYGVGKKPRNIARDGNGRLWVTCEETDEIHILNDDGTPHLVVPTGYGAGPFGITRNPAGDAMYVSYQSASKLARFSVSAPLAAPVLAVTFPTPRAIAVSADGGRILVTRFISAETNGEIGEFNATLTGAMKTATIRYAATTDGGDRAAGVPNYLAGIAISPDGTKAAVVSKQDNVLRGDLYGVGDLNPETTSRAVVSLVSLVEDSGSTARELWGHRKDFDNSDSPSSVTFSPYGDMLFVTLQGNNKVVGVDMMAFTPSSGSGTADTISAPATISAELATGAAPQGILIDASSNRMFVQNFMDRSVTVLDAAAYLTRNQTVLAPLATTNVVTNEKLSPRVLEGKRIFYHASEKMSQDGYISCATCHLDGGSDGRVWDFTGRGEGLRRTTDLRGRLGMGHGNVHWSGNFDEIQDFEHDIRGPFGGLGFLDLSAEEFAAQHASPASHKGGLNEELDALAAYVESLGAESVPRSPHRSADGSLTAAGIRGRQVFAGLNCASCHSGPEFTESSLSNVNTALLRDVGTLIGASGSRLGQGDLAGVDTPTLIGLHATQSYLHHGMAKSLDHLFRYAGGRTYHAGEAEFIMPEGSTSVKNTVTTTIGGGGDGRGYFNGDYVNIQGQPGYGVRFTQVDGGTGGTARLAFRYAMRYGNGTVTLTVNGASQTLSWLQQQPGNGYRTTGWRWHEIEIPLNPGTNNTIELLRGSREMGLDVMIVSNANDLAKAAVHRSVAALPQADQDDLIAYLRQIDARNDQGQLGVPPAIVSQPLSVTAQEGGTVTLSVVAEGTPAPSYQWKKGSVNVGTNSPTLTLSGITVAQGGAYTVVVTNSFGTVTSAAAQLVVRPNFANAGEGYSTVLEADFQGTNPSMNLPWSAATVLSPAIQYGGWTKGAGMQVASGNNELVFHQNQPSSEQASTLEQSIADQEYWSTTISPASGAIDLRAAVVQLGIRRIDWHASRRFAVFTSIGGFAAGQEIYDTGRFTDTVPMMFRFHLPATAAYRNVTGPVEIRIVGYGGQFAFHKASIYAFRLDLPDQGTLVLTGTADREYWTGIPGSNISALTGHASFPGSPAGHDLITTGLEGVGWSGSLAPGMTSNYGTDYGQRMRAYLVPEVSGEYTFWISGDDAAELWLSTSSNPAGKVRIAHHTAATGYREWNQSGTQKSVPISLEADASYYIEVLHKQGTSGDHVSVGWAKPGEGTAAPSGIVPPAVLSAFSEGSPVPVGWTEHVFNQASDFSGSFRKFSGSGTLVHQPGGFVRHSSRNQYAVYLSDPDGNGPGTTTYPVAAGQSLSVTSQVRFSHGQASSFGIVFTGSSGASYLVLLNVNASGSHDQLRIFSGTNPANGNAGTNQGAAELNGSDWISPGSSYFPVTATYSALATGGFRISISAGGRTTGHTFAGAPPLSDIQMSLRVYNPSGTANNTDIRSVGTGITAD